jgi:HAD superfamily hydrolase (TIGR01509 family)
MSIRAIIVDFYDVLYGEKDSAHLRAFEQSHGLSEGGLRQALSQSKYFHDARLGSVSGETLWRDVAEHLGTEPAEWQRLISVYESAFGLNEELVAFLQELHPHYKIALLSNATPHVRQVVTHRFHLGSLFDVMVISAEEGVKKPERASYERTLQRLLVPAEQAVFVDDDQEYVVAAQELGMHGIVFHTTRQMMTALSLVLSGQ